MRPICFWKRRPSLVRLSLGHVAAGILYDRLEDDDGEVRGVVAVDDLVEECNDFEHRGVKWEYSGYRLPVSVCVF